MLRRELIFHNHHTPQISEYAKFVCGKKLICRLIDVLGINNKNYGISGHLVRVETDENGKKYDIAQINVIFEPAVECGKHLVFSKLFSVQKRDEPFYFNAFIKRIKKLKKKYGVRKGNLYWT